MEVFGWIVFSVLAIFAIAMLVIFALPFVVSEIKSVSYKIKRYIDDKKFDLDKRSNERRHRDEIRRKKDFELANKRLDAKLLKVDKQIELQTKKLELAKELKQATSNQLEELNKASIENMNKVDKACISTNSNKTEEIANPEIKDTNKVVLNEDISNNLADIEECTDLTPDAQIE